MATSLVNTGVQFPDATIQTTAAASPIPAGTVMLFVQTAAPTGWTKSTANDNKALRVVSGTASTGGSTSFTSAFGTPAVSGSLSGTVGSHTLTTAEIPSHTHQQRGAIDGGANNETGRGGRAPSTGNSNTVTVATGGGGSHNHSFSGSLSSATAAINVQYVDVIIATKN
jgi:hypothetical protein